MRKMFLGVGFGLALAVLFLAGQDYLRGQMVKAKNMRFIADASTIVTALEQYKIHHGVYPAAMEVRGLEAALVPAILRSLPSWGLSYFSDGSTYTLLIRPAGDGPHAASALGLIEIRDGRWASWPDWLTEDELKRYLHELEPSKTSAMQPNYRLKPTDPRVTPLAGGRKRRATRSAA